MARQLGCSRNTVRRYLADEQATRDRPRAARVTKLEPFEDYLRERVAVARPHWIPAAVLLRELRERGYTGGVTQLKVWLAPLKRATPEPVVRFETLPGQQMQADFTLVRRGAGESCDMIGSGSESGGIARNRPPTPQRKQSGVEGAAADGRKAASVHRTRRP